MAARTEPTVFCEGIAGGPDVRLLEAARMALLTTHPLADRIELRPAGSWGNLPSLLTVYQHESAPHGALRDRDFMPRRIVEQQRGKSLRPFPLSRHCIDSYLLDSALFTAVAGVSITVYEAARDAEAERRQWLDAARGVIGEFVALHRLHPTLGAGDPADRSTAIGAVEAALAAFTTDVIGRRDAFDVAAEIDAMHRDFCADGPLWTRVDGKALLAALRDRFDPHGRLGDRDTFRGRLVDQAERNPPPALCADLGGLIDAMYSSPKV